MQHLHARLMPYAALFSKKETLSYALVGIVGVGLDAGLFFLLRNILSVSPTYLTMVSAITAAALTFPLNVYFTFKKSDNLINRFQIYIAVNVFGMLLGGALMYLGFEVLGIDDRLMKVISIFVVAATQFLLNKFVAFK